jgi:hypothetical protein
MSLPAGRGHPHTTEVIISCHCVECDGAEAVLTVRKLRHISRLPSRSQEQAIPDQERRMSTGPIPIGGPCLTRGHCGVSGINSEPCTPLQFAKLPLIQQSAGQGTVVGHESPPLIRRGAADGESSRCPKTTRAPPAGSP